jgi:hypothetical protein
MAQQCQRCGKEIIYVTSAYTTVQYQCLCSSCYNEIIQFEYRSVYKERAEYSQPKTQEEVLQELNKSKREFAQFITGQRTVFAHFFNAFSQSCKQVAKLQIKEQAFDIILEELIDTYLLHIIENNEKKNLIDNLITGDTCRKIVQKVMTLNKPMKREIENHFTKRQWVEYIRQNECVSLKLLREDPHWDEKQQKEYARAMSAYNDRLIQNKAHGNYSVADEIQIKLEYQHILLQIISTKALLFLQYIIVYFEISNLFRQEELKVIIDNLFSTGLDSKEIASRMHPLHHQYFRYDFTYELTQNELEELLIIYEKHQKIQLQQADEKRLMT